ncbi:hypothetical protein IPA_02485 [Ignicoccus pacificus DSM 13166]|uniref:Uncharacterized protein n=1 Tax=Ignicoccus pacificus DSM 13166 TaxID=940294 RepID=A0A977KBR8_9CREN|nr:hypothetical protein IPA_02485 [Ignicoccus pacificus DSM 13166]
MKGLNLICGADESYFSGTLCLSLVCAECGSVNCLSELVSRIMREYKLKKEVKGSEVSKLAKKKGKCHELKKTIIEELEYYSVACIKVEKGKEGEIKEVLLRSLLEPLGEVKVYADFSVIRGDRRKRVGKALVFPRPSHTVPLIQIADLLIHLMRKC